MNLCGSFAVMFHRGVSVPKRVELYCKCAICCTSITHWRAVVKKLRCLAKTWEKRSESSYRGEVSGSHSERGTVGSEEDGVGESTGVQRDAGPVPARTGCVTPSRSLARSVLGSPRLCGGDDWRRIGRMRELTRGRPARWAVGLRLEGNGEAGRPVPAAATPPGCRPALVGLCWAWVHCLRGKGRAESRAPGDVNSGAQDRE